MSLPGIRFARLTGLQDQTFASWIQRHRHERGDYQMAAPAPKASQRPVPVVRLMEAVMTGPGHPEADGAGQGHGIAQDLAALRHFDGAAFKKHRQPSVAP